MTACIERTAHQEDHQDQRRKDQQVLMDGDLRRPSASCGGTPAVLKRQAPADQRRPAVKRVRHGKIKNCTSNVGPLRCTLLQAAGNVLPPEAHFPPPPV